MPCLCENEAGQIMERNRIGAARSYPGGRAVEPGHPCAPIRGDCERDRNYRKAHPRLAPVVRRKPSAGADTRGWPDRRHRIGCGGGRLDCVLVGSQSCCLDRVGTEAALNGRQGAAWQNIKTGQSTSAMVAGCGRHGGHPICATARHKTAVASSLNGTPAGQSRRCRACQQDRAHGVGHDGAWQAV
jgi:hypothetical protein